MRRVPCIASVVVWTSPSKPLTVRRSLQTRAYAREDDLTLRDNIAILISRILVANAHFSRVRLTVWLTGTFPMSIPKRCLPDPKW